MEFGLARSFSNMVAGKLLIQRTDHSVNRWVGFYSFADGVVIKYCPGLLLDTRGRNLNITRFSSALLSFLGRRKMRFT